MTPAMRKAWNWLKNDMTYKPPEQLGTAEEVALAAFSYAWAKATAEEREECANHVRVLADAARECAMEALDKDTYAAQEYARSVLLNLETELRARGNA